MADNYPSPEYKWTVLLALFYDLLMIALFIIAFLQYIVNDNQYPFYIDYRVANNILIDFIIGAVAIVIIRVPRSIITINMHRLDCGPERR